MIADDDDDNSMITTTNTNTNRTTTMKNDNMNFSFVQMNKHRHRQQERPHSHEQTNTTASDRSAAVCSDSSIEQLEVNGNDDGDRDEFLTSNEGCIRRQTKTNVEQVACGPGLFVAHAKDKEDMDDKELYEAEADKKNQNEWPNAGSTNDGLMQIVESAELKLMRHKRQQQQQQQFRLSEQVCGQQAEESDKSIVVSTSNSATPSASANAKKKKKPTSLLLLKSPAFVTNTLDERHLERLASTTTSAEIQEENKPLHPDSARAPDDDCRRNIISSGNVLSELKEHPYDGKTFSTSYSSSSVSSSSCSSSFGLNQTSTSTQHSAKVAPSLATNMMTNRLMKMEQQGQDEDEEHDTDLGLYEQHHHHGNRYTSVSSNESNNVSEKQEKPDMCFSSSMGIVHKTMMDQEGRSNWEQQREIGQEEDGNFVTSHFKVCTSEEHPSALPETTFYSKSNNLPATEIDSSRFNSAQKQKQQQQQRNHILLQNSNTNSSSPDCGLGETYENHRRGMHLYDANSTYDESDEREGPTPTNDLIRSLIQKDRLAFGGSSAGLKSSGQHNESSQKASVPSPTTTTTTTITKTSLIRTNPAESDDDVYKNVGSFHRRNTGNSYISNNKSSNETTKIAYNNKTPFNGKQDCIMLAPTSAIKTEITASNKEANLSKSHQPLSPTSSSSLHSSTKSELKSPHPLDEKSEKRGTSGGESIVNNKLLEVKDPSLTTDKNSVLLLSSPFKEGESNNKNNNQNQRNKEGDGEKRKSSMFDLSALISKCQRLQLSSPLPASTTPEIKALLANNNSSNNNNNNNININNNDNSERTTIGEQLSPYQQFINRCISPRKPSDPSALLRAQQVAAANLANQQESLQKRRHSTYMLPILLNSITQKPGDKTSSDDDDDLQDANNSIGGSSSFSFKLNEEETVQDNKDDKYSANEVCYKSENDYENDAHYYDDDDDDDADHDDYDEDDLDRDLLMVEERDFKRKEGGSVFQQLNATLNRQLLPNSASSPSALSTPTNDRPCCDGSCCVSGGQQQQTKTTLNNNRLQQATFGKINYETNLANARKSIFSKLNEHQQQKTFTNDGAPKRRKRLGSNPIDRFIIRADRNESSSWKSRQQGNHNMVRKQIDQEQTSMSSTSTTTTTGARNTSAASSGPKMTGKRHSIINMFSGNHNHNHHHASLGRPLVSRLSHPKLLFSSIHQNSASSRLNNNNLEKQHHQQHYTTNPAYHMNEHYEPLIPESGFKIVVMGTSGSGKTSIIQRFMYNSFTWRHNPTIEDTYFIEFPYMKNTINISISDTSGTYQFPAMRKLAINSGDAFILVYSVDNVQSFDDLETLRQTILDEREQAYLEASSSSVTSSESSGFSGSITNSQASMNYNQQQVSAGNSNPLTRINNNLQRPPPAAAPSPSGQCNNTPYQEQNSKEELSQSGRHWSLASLFHNGGGHQHAHISYSSNSNAGPNPASSINTSICSSSNCSSSDNSRRSSVSAAEAALKTRRTRHPPMVIVANKHDLPEEQHLVNSDEIEALAVIDWNNGFVRASAALDWNINEIFQQVLKQARQPPTLAEAIVSKRRKSLPPKLPHSLISSNHITTNY